MSLLREETETNANLGIGAVEGQQLNSAGAEDNLKTQNVNGNNNIKVETDNTTKSNNLGQPTSGAGKPPVKKTPNDYIFGKLLGEGSFSSVYLAKDVRSHREYAIKVCDKKFILREKKAELIQREKEVMTILSRNPSKVAPFFVHLSATFQDSERLYFVMTYASGGELLKLLTTHERFDMEVCRFYAGEILQALRHLHSLKIVHRDLKPENILLNQNGHILLTDYGSAKIMPTVNPAAAEEEAKTVGGGDSTDGSNNDESRKRTRRNSFVGTAQYVSPEILQGKYSIVGPPVDLWAFGCVVYQFLTGSSPFNGPNEYLIFQKITKLEYNFPIDFDSHARSLVSSLLVLEPAERIGSKDNEPYTSIQSHEFFSGINLDELHTRPPPTIWSSSSPTKVPSTTSSQRSNVPDNLEPGYNPRVIAERILRSDGDFPMAWGTNSGSTGELNDEPKIEQVTLKVDLSTNTKKSESSFSNDAGVHHDKSDSSTPNKNPPTRCYCC